MNSFAPLVSKCGLALLLVFASGRLCAQPVFSEDRLLQACLTLQQEPLAPDALALLETACSAATNSPAVRSRAMAAFALSFLMRGDASGFARASDAFRSAFPEAAALINVTPDDAFVPCKDCSGSGVQLAPCPVCNGAAVVFQPKETVRTNYTARLHDLAAVCRENATFAERSLAAANEKELDKRIERLRTIFQTFPHRKDLGPLQGLLTQTVNARNTELSRRRVLAEKEKAAREKNELLRLRDVKSDGLNAAILKVQAALTATPRLAAEPELNALAEELLARRKRLDRLRKSGYGLAALLGLLFLVTLLRRLQSRR